MKFINYAILLVVVFFASGWLFNHVNAWAGIGLSAVVIYILLQKLFKFIKESSHV
jgi:hypothetical protein